MAREDAFLWCEAIAVFTLAISLLAPFPARAENRDGPHFSQALPNPGSVPELGFLRE